MRARGGLYENIKRPRSDRHKRGSPPGLPCFASFLFPFPSPRGVPFAPHDCAPWGTVSLPSRRRSPI